LAHDVQPPKLRAGHLAATFLDPLKDVLAGLSAEPSLQGSPRVNTFAAWQAYPQPGVRDFDQAEAPVGIVLHEFDGGFLAANQDGKAILFCFRPDAAHAVDEVQLVQHPGFVLTKEAVGPRFVSIAGQKNFHAIWTHPDPTPRCRPGKPDTVLNVAAAEVNRVRLGV
jgi:hypothetical protein